MDGTNHPRKDDARMYDRAALVAAAREAGDHTPSDTARRLKVARNTAWRLWNGHTAPSAVVAAAVEQHYGVSTGQLVKRAAA
ncbi:MULTISPECIES: XRE family transcriptional regulator [Streptomyces]|uniref:XRE family transcriptional regulator n=1 Tax=Streptomyces TaxID=1883 RepID=UPI0013A6AF1A|nr:XRE family transcriptional regulator [Streptomyces griseorubiginosus]